MDESLRKIRRDLAETIAELKQIAQGIASDFQGIGEQSCGVSVMQIMQMYQKKLNAIDYELSKRSAKSGTFGGGSGGGHF